MKKFILGIVVLVTLLAVCFSRAETNTGALYEYAIVKWDGPDRLYYNLPNKFEMVHIEKEGVVIPKDAQAEEFCLAYASNKMAQDRWEPINLDSRRILFRRMVRNTAP